MAIRLSSGWRTLISISFFIVTTFVLTNDQSASWPVPSSESQQRPESEFEACPH